MRFQFCFLSALKIGPNAMAIKKSRFESVLREAKFEVRQ